MRGWTGGDDDGGGGGTRGRPGPGPPPRPSVGTQGWASPDASRSENDRPRTCGERISGWRCERDETCPLMLGWWRRRRCTGTLSVPRARGFPTVDGTHRRRHHGVPSVLQRQSPPWHRDGAKMRARRVSRDGEGGGGVSGGCGLGGVWDGCGDEAAGAAGGGARGSRGPRPAPPASTEPQGTISSGGSDHSSDKTRSCGELRCGGATGMCRACQGGVGGGVRNAEASRAHARKLGFMGPAFWRRNQQPNPVFFLFFGVHTSPRKKISDGQKNISHFYQTDAHTTRFFFIFFFSF